MNNDILKLLSDYNKGTLKSIPFSISLDNATLKTTGLYLGIVFFGFAVIMLGGIYFIFKK